MMNEGAIRQNNCSSQWNEYRLPNSLRLSPSNLANRQLPEISLDIRREPPPPYWEHHNHPIVVVQERQENGFESVETSSINYNDYEPDLVRNCTTATIDDQAENEDYANIAEVLNNFSHLIINNNNNGNSNDPTKDINVNHDNTILTSQKEVMGQNLSLRRPKISLTWVLREQQQQERQQQINQQSSQSLTIINKSIPETPSSSFTHKKSFRKFLEKKKKNRDIPNEKLFNEKYLIEPIKNNSNSNLNHTNKLIPPQLNHNINNNINLNNKNGTNYLKDDHQNEIQNHNNINNNNNLVTSHRSCRLKKNDRNNKILENSNNLPTTISSNQSDLGGKNNYSEPLIYAASDGPPKRHRQRKRKDRTRTQRFGYEIKNVDEFLSRCSLTSPANIPVVLSSATTLYQTRPGGYQSEIPLPLGMVVNAIFKNESWLYVQTPHAEEGYVAYTSCLPLGILPPARSSPTSLPPPCWENTGDVFPKPCGNMTDSEKEIQLRGGTRSEGARTPRLRRVKVCGEKNVDALYLRAASQPKLSEKCYAQLKPPYKTKINYASSIVTSEKSNDDYMTIQKKNPRPLRKTPSITSAASTINKIKTVVPPPRPLRQTLLAITEHYVSDTISVQKGDVVILLACKENAKTPTNMQQWFYVRTRENLMGFIPAEVAGHGFL